VAAALSTAAGLLLVISSSVSHDLLKSTWMPGITERQELLYARIAAATAIVVAGLAAASLFPAIFMGIFFRRINKEGAIAGMVVGLLFTFSYIVFFKFVSPELDTSEYWWLGISPQGIGVVGALLNMAVATGVSLATESPPSEVEDMLDSIRRPQKV